MQDDQAQIDLERRTRTDLSMEAAAGSRARGRSSIIKACSPSFRRMERTTVSTTLLPTWVYPQTSRSRSERSTTFGCRWFM
jgi:hypothetical protein